MSAFFTSRFCSLMKRELCRKYEMNLVNTFEKHEFLLRIFSNNAIPSGRRIGVGDDDASLAVERGVGGDAQLGRHREERGHPLAFGNRRGQVKRGRGRLELVKLGDPDTGFATVSREQLGMGDSTSTVGQDQGVSGPKPM